ncbi:copper chaperone PCu(A)C [Pseudoroseicyclus aestuarii]|uniref:YncI copper-binding domain-containing protein n=1 Tax=Pseudoroseicyclus aestuarii TaxID=1795041 RepID=A0A318STU1_9RHOB|nr:copper chaperone PCu(A)C [Pseudoroseicyclus aestuarii]PYE84872.1 hypothetical protein DFP88_102676 [Pseudoroseicyclus aestuarii]
MTLKTLLRGSALGAALLTAGSAGAHVTLTQAETAASGSYVATFRVPHGCEGAATDTVRVTLPEGFYAAKPMPKPGWDLEIETGPYAEPYDNHGTTMTEGPREITWSGGSLEDAWYDEFSIRGSFAGTHEVGEVVYFPVVQFCDEATEAWTATGGEAEGGEGSAPKVTLTQAEAQDGHHHDHGGHGDHGDHGAEAGHHDHHDAGDAQEAAVQVGDLTIAAPFARATLPNQPVGGGYLTITNDGEADDRLTAVTSDASDRAEVHEMSMDGDVMTMRALDDGLVIPAGETVELRPGGYHLMFMDLEAPVEEGATLNVTLTFEQAGEVSIEMPVRAPNAGSGGMDHGDHGDHSGHADHSDHMDHSDH